MTRSSFQAVANPEQKINEWKRNVRLYGENSQEAIDQLVDMLVVTAIVPVGAAAGLYSDTSMQVGVWVAQGFLVGREVQRHLSSRDESQRADAVRKYLQAITVEQQSANAAPLVDRLTELAGQDSEKAYQAIELLATLNKPNNGELNILPAVPLAAGAVVALAAALSTTQATPEG